MNTISVKCSNEVMEVTQTDIATEGGEVMARMIRGVLFCFLFLAWSCAPIEPPAAGPGHPANPEAESALLPDLSDELDVDEHNLPGPPPEMQAGNKMHHQTPHKSDPMIEEEDKP